MKDTKSVVGDAESYDGIPASVLTYERQLRKAQHSKKVGKVLNASDLRVVYVDEHLVVVNKPPGVLSVPGVNSQSSLLDLVHQKFGQEVTDPASMIVHRLDMDTSGLLVFGRSTSVTKKLHAEFRDHKVTKRYDCLIMGHLPIRDVDLSSTGCFEIDLPLQRDHEHQAEEDLGRSPARPRELSLAG